MNHFSNRYFTVEKCIHQTWRALKGIPVLVDERIPRSPGLLPGITIMS